MTRPNPFDELEDLFERMSRQFEGAEWSTMTGNAIAVDLLDEDDAYELIADLPGYDRDDIDLTIADGALHIEAERSESTEEADPAIDYVRRERRRSRVTRTIRLPEPIEEDAAEARYANGVLTVNLPKREPGADGTQIDIE